MTNEEGKKINYRTPHLGPGEKPLYVYSEMLYKQASGWLMVEVTNKEVGI